MAEMSCTHPEFRIFWLKSGECYRATCMYCRRSVVMAMDNQGAIETIRARERLNKQWAIREQLLDRGIR